MSPHGALRMAAPRSWASAVKAVCRQVASQVLAWDWYQARTSFPVLNLSSIVMWARDLVSLPQVM